MAEVNALRRVVENKFLWNTYAGPEAQSTSTTISRSYMPQDKDNAVEQMVRTHMQAGHTADDLLKSEQK